VTVHSIVSAVDFSEQSCQVLRWAGTFAESVSESPDRDQCGRPAAGGECTDPAPQFLCLPSRPQSLQEFGSDPPGLALTTFAPGQSRLSRHLTASHDSWLVWTS
jgi:hypothetical protein